mmetsp:Transcript_5170/g.9338  ORF Transcript_5170/g.9338 Transcript_5170/m.9338 type:complete len:135 (+) Transcript_5170:150-554(+)
MRRRSSEATAISVSSTSSDTSQDGQDGQQPLPQPTKGKGGPSRAALRRFAQQQRQAQAEDSLRLPSVGSLSHDAGTCKPCVFLFKEGCNSGKNCSFCHLCPPGEKKRRKKERRTRTKKFDEAGEAWMPQALIAS